MIIDGVADVTRRVRERHDQEVRWSLAVVCSPSPTQRAMVEGRAAAVRRPGLGDGPLGKPAHTWYARGLCRLLLHSTGYSTAAVVSDIAIFVLKRDVKLPTN